MQNSTQVLTQATNTLLLYPENWYWMASYHQCIQTKNYSLVTGYCKIINHSDIRICFPRMLLLLSLAQMGDYYYFHALAFPNFKEISTATQWNTTTDTGQSYYCTILCFFLYRQKVLTYFSSKFLDFHTV